LICITSLFYLSDTTPPNFSNPKTPRESGRCKARRRIRVEKCPSYTHEYGSSFDIPSFLPSCLFTISQIPSPITGCIFFPPPLLGPCNSDLPCKAHCLSLYNGRPPTKSLHDLTSLGIPSFLGSFSLMHCAKRTAVLGSMNSGTPKSTAFLLIT